MRVISQTGDDIPYERCVFTIFGEFVYAAPIYNLENKFVVASYSTQEKAEKAMQKLHNCYQEWVEGVVFRFPLEDEI